LKEGVSIKTLARNYNISTRTIRNWDKKSHSGSLVRQKGSGRKRKLNFSDSELLEEIFDSNRNIGSRKLVPIIKKQMNTSLSEQTIRRYRKQNDWIWVRPKTIPKISEKDKEKRKMYCKLRSKYEWKNVIFADESQIKLFRNTSSVCIKKGEERPRKEGSNSRISVMVWGGISWCGKTKIVFIKDFYPNSKSRMNSEIYINILEQVLLPFVKKKYENDGFEFLHDNSPVHKSKMTKNWFKDNSIKLLPFPSYSPDLNPIEKIWNDLKDMVEKESPTTEEQLKNSIIKNWKSIPLKKIRAHIKHLEKIIPKIIKNQGEFID